VAERRPTIDPKLSVFTLTRVSTDERASVSVTETRGDDVYVLTAVQAESSRLHSDYCDYFQQHVDREACQGLADSIDLDTALRNHNNHYQSWGETRGQFAHVRAANPELAVQRLNFHPFLGGQHSLEDRRDRAPTEEGRQELMFMYNCRPGRPSGATHGSTGTDVHVQRHTRGLPGRHPPIPSGTVRKNVLR
jgi:hypothetical protein